MKTLSWLCGTLAIAFLLAGFLLVFQPSTVLAGGGGSCANCQATCDQFNNQQSRCNGFFLCAMAPGQTCGNTCECNGWANNFCPCE